MDEEQLRRNRQRRMEYRRRQQEKRIKRNRIIIIGVGVVLLILIIWAISSCASGGDSKASTEPTKPTGITTQAPTEPPTQAVPVIADNNQDGILDDSGIYIWNKQGFELFSGTEATAKNYAQAISTYKKELGSEITVYNLVVPGHVEFGLPQRLKAEVPSNSQSENTATIYNSYTEDVKPVNIYDSLDMHKNEYIFFNTDHHWTGLGAYYGYTEFAKAAGFDPVALVDLDAHDISGFVGSLYTATESSDLQSNPDTVTYYDISGTYSTEILVAGNEDFTEVSSINYPDVDADNAYSVFIWGDNPVTQIKQLESNGSKKIVVVKESYGNAFVPFLVNHYDEVHVIDFRHYEGNLKNYCTENGIKEVLFLNGIMSANNAMQVDTMTTLFS